MKTTGSLPPRGAAASNSAQPETPRTPPRNVSRQTDTYASPLPSGPVYTPPAPRTNPDEVNAKSLVMLLEYLEKLPEAVRNHKTRSSAQEKEATFHLRCAQELSNWLVENSMPENLIYTIRDFANLNGRSSRTYLISKRNDLDAINAYIDQLAKFALHLKKQANEADSLLLLTSDVQKRLDALMELFKKL